MGNWWSTVIFSPRRSVPMPKRRRAAEDEASVEAWLAEAQASLTSSPSVALAPDGPAWPRPILQLVQSNMAIASSAPDDARAAAATAALLRLAIAFGIGSQEWNAFMNAQLARQVRKLRKMDDDFDASARVFNHHTGCCGSGGSDSGCLRRLRTLSGLDALYWSIWAVGCRQRRRVPHPVRLLEKLSSALLATPSHAQAVRSLLVQMDLPAANALGVRRSWLEGKSKSPWRTGACAMLRYLRARWAEACCHMDDEARRDTGASRRIDASHARTRAALLRWHVVGRDACARHMAFACPSEMAIEAIVSGGGDIVELGAGNGYWSKLVAKLMSKRRSVHSVRALDTAPPPDWRQPPEVTVQFGTAEQLAEGREQTLLLCMPSPGEVGIADDALSRFHGQRIVYVGEWASGMTGTREAHTTLLQRYRHACSLPLPCMALTRIALHIFLVRDATSGESHDKANVAPSPPGGTCAACGATSALRACPWTRKFLACSVQCHERAAKMHSAIIALNYYGAAVSARPPFDSFEPCMWLECGEATDQQWLRLAEATPQPERELPS